MFAVYETIDLGLVSTLVQTQPQPWLLDLLQGNHPVLLPDPIHDDAVYVYHAFGVHALHVGSMLRRMNVALRESTDSEGDLVDALHHVGGTDVRQILNSFSVEQQYAPFLDYYSILSSYKFQVLESYHWSCHP
jgi:nucleoporin NUP82